MPWPSGGPRTWNPGETVTADQMNEQLRDALNVLKTYIDDDGKPLPFLAVKRQTATVTKTSSTVYSDLTGLAFPIGINEEWVCLAMLFGTAANATPDMKFTFTGPAAPTAVKFGIMNEDVALTQGFNTTFGADVATSKGAVNSCLVLGGLFRNGANVGTIQAQFAQNNSNPNAVAIQENSFLVAVRIL